MAPVGGKVACFQGLACVVPCHCSRWCFSTHNQSGKDCWMFSWVEAGCAVATTPPCWVSPAFITSNSTIHIFMLPLNTCTALINKVLYVFCVMPILLMPVSWEAPALWCSKCSWQVFSCVGALDASQVSVFDTPVWFLWLCSQWEPWCPFVFHWCSCTGSCCVEELVPAVLLTQGNNAKLCMIVLFPGSLNHPRNEIWHSKGCQGVWLCRTVQKLGKNNACHMYQFQRGGDGYWAFPSVSFRGVTVTQVVSPHPEAVLNPAASMDPPLWVVLCVQYSFLKLQPDGTGTPKTPTQLLTAGSGS